MHRFFAPTSFASDTAELTGPEAHHLLHVLRLGVGDDVELFDGRGVHAICQIESTARQAVRLRIISRAASVRATTRSVILATAMPKGDRLGWLVEKATELGVDRLIPLITQRSVVDAGAGKLDKLRRTVIEACKQCGRDNLMTIDPPSHWSDVVAREFVVPDRLILVAHPGGEPWPLEGWLGSSAASPLRDALIAIGPEGGFTDEEVQLAQRHGARLVHLVANVLRIETAAIAAVAGLVLATDETRMKHGQK
ncbi:MAG: 16S rRNA (uracil(1498)-N(3))-methyltransferase [Planctomycetales bacterium]|nr:16S rRNA (uracil(1498)-N(3))-methyltransferase [Planctomycetales bacterium]